METKTLLTNENPPAAKPLLAAGVLSDEQKKVITVAYENVYGEIWPGQYLSMWLSKKGCVMIRHLIEDDCWSRDRLIRQINFGKLNDLLMYNACS